MQIFARGLILGLIASVLSTASANVKVGVVDLQRALQETKRGKTSSANFEKEAKDREKKFKTEQESIRKQFEEFQKKAAVLNEKARAEQQAKLQAKLMEVQQMGQKFQMEVEEKRTGLAKPIIDGLRALIPDVSRRRSLDLVLEANSGLLFAMNQTDVTDELIKLYDEKNP